MTDSTNNPPRWEDTTPLADDWEPTLDDVVSERQSDSGRVFKLPEDVQFEDQDEPQVPKGFTLVSPEPPGITWDTPAPLVKDNMNEQLVAAALIGVLIILALWSAWKVSRNTIVFRISVVVSALALLLAAFVGFEEGDEEAVYAMLAGLVSYWGIAWIFWKKKKQA